MFRVSLGFFLRGNGSSIIVWEPQPEHSRRKINPNLLLRGQQHFPSQSILAVVPLFGQCLISRITSTTNIFCTVTSFGRSENVLAGVAGRGRSNAIVVPCRLSSRQGNARVNDGRSINTNRSISARHQEEARPLFRCGLCRYHSPSGPFGSAQALVGRCYFVSTTGMRSSGRGEKLGPLEPALSPIHHVSHDVVPQGSPMPRATHGTSTDSPRCRRARSRATHRFANQSESSRGHQGNLAHATKTTARWPSAT
jgi:hypothetical protein